MIGIFLLIFYISLFISLFIYISVKDRKITSQGEIYDLFNNEYKYILGDNIEYRKNGIVVDLNVNIPNFYIDNISDNKDDKGTFYYFTDSEQLVLEGNFGDKYMIFCPKDTQQAVLAFLTPDVMESIYRYVKDFDIQFVGTKIWLLSDPKVYKNEQIKSDLINGINGIVLSLSKKLQIYSAKNYTFVEQKYNNQNTYRLFNRYILKVSFKIYTLFFFISLFMAVPILLVTDKYLAVIILILFFFPILPFILSKIAIAGGVGMVANGLDKIALSYNKIRK